MTHITFPHIALAGVWSHGCTQLEERLSNRVFIEWPEPAKMQLEVKRKMEVGERFTVDQSNLSAIIYLGVYCFIIIFPFYDSEFCF